MTRTMDVLVKLDVLDCSVCHLTFAVDRSWVRDRHRDHVTFYCPNGHQQYFPQKSDLELEREKVAAERAKLQSARAVLTHEQDQRQAAERSARAWKGHATRARRKAAHGVCPAPGCGRTFQDLARHMAGRHPTYVAEHGPVKAGE